MITEDQQYAHRFASRECPFPLNSMSGVDPAGTEAVDFGRLFGMADENVCTVCDIKFTNHSARLGHMVFEHDVPAFIAPHLTCLGCGQFFLSPTVAKEHRHREHDGKYVMRGPVVAEFARLILKYVQDLGDAVGMADPARTDKTLTMMQTKLAKAICLLGTENGRGKGLPRFSAAKLVDDRIVAVYRHLMSNGYTKKDYLSESVLLAREMYNVYVFYKSSIGTGTTIKEEQAAMLTESRVLVYMIAGVRTVRGEEALVRWKSRGTWYKCVNVGEKSDASFTVWPEVQREVVACNNVVGIVQERVSETMDAGEEELVTE